MGQAPVAQQFQCRIPTVRLGQEAGLDLQVEFRQVPAGQVVYQVVGAKLSVTVNCVHYGWLLVAILCRRILQAESSDSMVTPY